MFKKILAVTAMLLATAAYAAVDANKGGAADFDALKGVGPAMSKRIVDARQQGEFKDWSDLMQRVKGMKEKTAAKLSGEGLTVNGQAFKGAATTGSAKSETRAAKPAVAAAK
ncbi:MAG: helix-hairpin-helix domain-containing protein [Variovorax sp.]|nr:MAG: helix-hairpin-helix domain-containing protein [Variovorax sp.]